MYQAKSTPCDLSTLFVRGLIDSIETSSHYSWFERINCQENFQIRDSFPWQITSYNRSSKPPQHSSSPFPTQGYMLSLSVSTISSLWLFSNPAWPSCVHSILVPFFGLLTPPRISPPRWKIHHILDSSSFSERETRANIVSTRSLVFATSLLIAANFSLQRMEAAGRPIEA